MMPVRVRYSYNKAIPKYIKGISGYTNLILTLSSISSVLRILRL